MSLPFRFFPLAALLGTAFLGQEAHGQLRLDWIREFGLGGTSPLATSGAPSVSVAGDGVYVILVEATDWRVSRAKVLKYSLNGDVVWIHELGQVRAEQVTATTNGVYVVWRTGDWPGNGYSLRKLDQNGNYLWTRLFTPFDFYPRTARATPDGFYLAGYLAGAPVVRKHDLDGLELWTRQLGNSDQVYISAISATADGVYVAGVTRIALAGQTLLGDFDAYIRKYDPYGNELWTREFMIRQLDYAIYLAAVFDGVYVAMAEFGTTTHAVLKYDRNGALLGNTQSPANSGQSVGLSATAEAVFVSLFSESNHAYGVAQYDPVGRAIANIPLSAILPGKSVHPGDGAISASSDSVYVAGNISPIGSDSPRALLMRLVPESTTPRPVSRVSALPTTVATSSFLVQWSGDSAGGAAIQDYTIYVSDNGGPFTPWLTQTMATEATFIGTPLRTYGFYSIARDTAGNFEYPKTWAEAITRVADTTKPVSHVSALAATAASPNFLVRWSGTDSGSGVCDYTIYLSDNGGLYTPWLTQTGVTQAWFSGLVGHTYRFFSIARDNDGNEEDMKTGAEAATQVPAVMPADVNGDLGIDCSDIAVVKASLGKKTGQPGFDARADVNKDGVVDIRDLAAVTQKLAPTTKCQ